MAFNLDTARGQVAAQIAEDNPSFTVHDYPISVPDNLGAGRVVVSVFRESITPTDLVLTHGLTVNIFVQATTAAGENRLDDALDEVLLSIQRLDALNVTEAKRAVFEERMPGWQIAVEAYSQNIYRSAVQNERSI